MTEAITCDAWAVASVGSPTDVMERTAVEVAAPGPNEARVVQEAFCLNLNDVDLVRGRYTTLSLAPPFVPGMEAVGVVESAGPGAEHLVGQRIIGIPVMANGGYATHALVDAASALTVPATMSSVDAAAMHFPFHLGWLALVERARLAAGETVLVHAGAGGIGSGALQLAKARGARVIATAGSPEKVAFCLELGADHAIDYRSTDWVAVVEELTYGAGVDVAFDTIGGDVTLQTFRCMAFNGRHMIVGFSEDIGLEDASYITARPLAFGNFSVGGVCLAYVSDPLGFRRSLGFNFPSRATGQSAHEQLLELLRTGAIRTVVGRRLGFDEIPAALESIERRETMGRQVVVL